VAFNIHAAEPHTRAFACLFEQMAAQVQAQASKQHGKDSGAGDDDMEPMQVHHPLYMFQTFLVPSKLQIPQQRSHKLCPQIIQTHA
jgi:hypothetical protein